GLAGRAGDVVAVWRLGAPAAAAGHRVRRRAARVRPASEPAAAGIRGGAVLRSRPACGCRGRPARGRDGGAPDPAHPVAGPAVTAEGAGWLRSVKLERAAGRWRVTAGEQGDLDAALRRAGEPRAALPGAEDPALLRDALDVDLGYCPLTNTPPVRRLGLLRAR